MEARWVMGTSSFFLGEFAVARQHWEHGIALYDPRQHAHHTVLFGVDLGVFCRSLLSHALWHLGYPEQALQQSHTALDLAQELSHPFSLAVALDYAAMLHQFRREAAAARERAEAAMALCTEHGFAYYLAWATFIRGWAVMAQDRGTEGLEQMRQGLADLQATGGGLRLPYYLALLAEACGDVGQSDDGLTLLAEALAQTHSKGEYWRQAELYLLQGELLLQPGTGQQGQGNKQQEVEAEKSFRHALAMAQQQQAKSLELQAAVHLSQLWQQQGKHAAAREMLAAVYGWFTEGFDTPDLQDAQALLAALHAC
jgi:predicted ATPase